MSNLIWLGIAVVLSVIGWTVLWLRNRRPHSTEASLREFSRELQALAPPAEPQPPRSRSPRSEPPPQRPPPPQSRPQRSRRSG